MSSYMKQRLAVLVAVTVFISLAVAFGVHAGSPTTTLSSSLFLFFACLVCEFVDSTLGMGFGTMLTPLLLLTGFDAKVVVPVILLSELFTGAFAAFGHHAAGSVNLRPGSKAFTVGVIIGCTSIIGSLIAVQASAVLPKDTLNMIISVILFCVGVFMLAVQGRTFRFSWFRIVGLGILASFNKAISGGGYGPLVVSGQLLSGVEARGAIAIASFAEMLTCLSGFTFYLLRGSSIDWMIAVPVLSGALCSVPFSVLVVKHAKTKTLTTFIACVVILLSITTFVAL